MLRCPSWGQILGLVRHRTKARGEGDKYLPRPFEHSKKSRSNSKLGWYLIIKLLQRVEVVQVLGTVINEISVEHISVVH